VKKILILHTGGTIGMGLKKHFLHLVPEMARLAKIHTLVLDNIDSSNVTPKHWVKWLEVLKKNYASYDGFIFTHGTDSMAYTGSAFSFALKRLNKPVILTGSQRPLAHIRSDARDNLINSVEMACHGPKEVSICFGNELLRANRTTKLSATDYVAFESFNFPLLAKMGMQIKKNWPIVKTSNPTWQAVFDERVFCFKIFPGISGDILKATISNENCQGVVLEAFGAGNVPSFDDSVIGMIKLAKKLKKPVVIVSQCPHGQVDLNLYETGMDAKKAGAISAGDMTQEATVVKLMHGLGLGLSGKKLQYYFNQNICGERSI
jgi:L-asparaginase